MHRHLNSREAKRLHTKEPVFPVGRMDAEVMDPGSRRVVSAISLAVGQLYPSTRSWACMLCKSEKGRVGISKTLG